MKNESGDRLTDAVTKIDAAALKGSLVKSEVVQFRVTKPEKQSVKQTADNLNLSVSEYLLKVHFLVQHQLTKGQKA